MRLSAHRAGLLAAAWLAVSGCAARAPRGASDAPLRPAAAEANERGLDLLLAERRARARLEALRTWHAGTSDLSFEAPSAAEDPDAERRALEEAQLAAPAGGAAGALAVRFVRASVLRQRLLRATAPFDRALAAAQADSAARVPFAAGPIALADLSMRIAGEPDAACRAALESARQELVASRLGPLLMQREHAAQSAARALGFADYAALSEELVQADLGQLLSEGARYVRATEGPFRAALDRAAREDLGVGREELGPGDMARLWAAPALARYFPPERAQETLRWFLGGIGLSLQTAAGTWVQVDDAARPSKRARAFVEPVDAPGDVRLSIKGSAGLGGYWALFHEAGHAVHYAQATLDPPELRTLGHAAPGEGFGELFRLAFADPRFLLRYRDFLATAGGPAPTGPELATIARRTALREMAFLRRTAFAEIAWELRLHGRPLSSLGPALPLLPAPERLGEGLDELYRQLFSVAEARPVQAFEAAAGRLEVDDFFRAADYARAFTFALGLREALVLRFGAGWSEDRAVGELLRGGFFAAGTSLSAAELAARLGLSLDAEASARRSIELLAIADWLEAPTAAQKGSAPRRSATLAP